MKIVNQPKAKKITEAENQQNINDTLLSLGQAIEALHEGFKEMSLKFEVATNFLSISKEQFETAVQELKDKNFDDAFKAQIRPEHTVLNIGDRVLEGDVVVASLYNKEGKLIIGRILINVGDEFYGQKIEANFNVGDSVEILQGSFRALKAVRLV